MTPRPGLLPVTPASVLCSGCVLGLTGYWIYKVTETVPDPYLDEVFHIRQALTYWANNWGQWDPKITTPPGLYVASYAWLWLLQAFRVSSTLVTQLRSLNLVQGAATLYFVSRQLLYDVPRPKAVSGDALFSIASSQTRLLALEHAAVNVCLFPPLFFYHALFYTDITSSAVVLHAYMDFRIQQKVNQYLLSVAALCLRQTNISWVAIYLGGLEVVQNLSKERSRVESTQGLIFVGPMAQSWENACLYDPLASEAFLEDYIKTCVSLVFVALANCQRLLWPLLPYLSLLFGFGSFVLWNGGVVLGDLASFSLLLVFFPPHKPADLALGDKDNHIASIHLSQMLYIWPYITFFSLPLSYPYVLNAVFPQHMLPRFLRTGSTSHLLPRRRVTFPILVGMLVIVHYNTIVHPFTLADNRHYTFYVFRLLLRHPSVKYLAVPVYYVCAWAAIVALGGYPCDNKKEMPSDSGERVGSYLKLIGISEEDLSTLPAASVPLPAASTRVSFVVVWLLATSLSVVTAPLVEPRYFIIPWLIWRLQVPTSMHLRATDPELEPRLSDKEYQRTRKKEHNRRNGPPKAVTASLWKYDHRLIIETVWFLAVNLVIGYIFLGWGFEWEQEKGIVQRFMW
ncbi:glucosyltransferase [Lambiella insularis]|nr:glucosyltransferase [Lambiella insularis]